MSNKWKVMTLADAGVILLDCDHKTPGAVPFGRPYVGIPQMTSGRIDFATARRITEADFITWTRKTKYKQDDVVLSRRTNPGVTAIDDTGTEFALGQNLVLLRADGRSVYPPFLRWLVRGPEWWTQIEKFINVGAVFSSLRCRDVPNFELTIPPLSEQRAIAATLGALDDKIELNRKMNDTLEAMARALFRDWFVDFGPTRAKMEGRPAYLSEDLWSLFPDRLDDEGKPEGWKMSPLDELAEVTMGSSPDGKTYNDKGEGIPLCNGPVEYGDYFLRQIKWTTAPTKLAYRGDLIICVRGSTTGRHAFADTVYCLGRGVASIRGKDNLQEFVEVAVLSQMNRLLQKTTGSVFPSLSTQDIKKFELVDPDLPLRRAFCRAVRPLRERVWVNVEEAYTLAELRDLLLPRLMSGELRVHEVERFVEEKAS